MDDLISRQAFLAEMKDMYRAAEKWKDEATTDDAKARAESCMATLIEMKLRAEKMPSAQKTGAWIDHQEGKWIYAQCNICGTTWDAKSNYCPNCGARMEDNMHDFPEHARTEEGHNGR